MGFFQARWFFVLNEGLEGLVGLHLGDGYDSRDDDDVSNDFSI